VPQLSDRIAKRRTSQRRRRARSRARDPRRVPNRDSRGSGIGREPPATKPLVQGSAFLAVLWAAATIVLLVVYYPALRGEFVSDDSIYIVKNIWIHRFGLANLREILDPWGGPASFTANFAPVILLLHALQWSLFGANPLGYHLTNIGLHALVSVLLVPLLRRAGVAPQAALFGAALFLLHPANVEVVAWVSQEKTLVAMALAQGALLFHPRRPVLAVLCFVLAILTKGLAAFALPVAAWWVWAKRHEQLPRLGWLAVWVALLCLYAAPEFTAFGSAGELGAPLGHDVATHLRTIIAFAARYTAMALTSFGVGPLHQPPLATSIADPWFLCGILLGLLFGWRALLTLRRSSPEGGFWIWAAIAYAPISQIFPFVYPLADRYLYFILPGGIGAVLLAGQEALSRVAFVHLSSTWRIARGLTRDRMAIAIALLACTSFALRTNAQAWSWRSGAALVDAAVRGSPDGISAHLRAAEDAARQADAGAAATELRAAADRGWNDVVGISYASAFAPVRNDPRFQAALVELAGRFIEDAKRSGLSSQPALLCWARAHEIRGERAEQRALLERTIAVGGPWTDLARRLLAEAERVDEVTKPRD